MENNRDGKTKGFQRELKLISLLSSYEIDAIPKHVYHQTLHFVFAFENTCICFQCSTEYNDK